MTNDLIDTIAAGAAKTLGQAMANTTDDIKNRIIRGTNLPDSLTVCLNIRSAIKENLGATSFELTRDYCRQLADSLERDVLPAADKIEAEHEALWQENQAELKGFSEGLDLLKNPLSPKRLTANKYAKRLMRNPNQAIAAIAVAKDQKRHLQKKYDGISYRRQALDKLIADLRNYHEDP